MPWPSIYYSLANALNVVSLDFLRLPNIACLDPGVSFYIIFNGVTITTFIYIAFCMLTYYYGARTSVALEDIDRRRRFKTQCLNAFIWCVQGLVRCAAPWPLRRADARLPFALAQGHLLGLSAGGVHHAEHLCVR